MYFNFAYCTVICILYSYLQHVSFFRPTQWYLNIDHALTLARLKYPALISAYQQTANWMDMSSSEDTLYPSILFNSFGSLYWDPLAHRSLWHLPCATGICVLWFIYQRGTKVMFKGLYQFAYPLKKEIHDIKSQVCAAVPFSIHHFIKRFCGPTFYKGVLLKKIYNFVFHRRNKVIEVLKNLRVSKWWQNVHI